MATIQQIEANRRNAQKSTGPVTPEGKAVVSQNAFKHGLCSFKPVLAYEDPAAWDDFHSTLLNHYQPVGPEQQLLVERIIGTAWRLQRIGRIETEMINDHNDYLTRNRLRPEANPLGKALQNTDTIVNIRPLRIFAGPHAPPPRQRSPPAPSGTGPRPVHSRNQRNKPNSR